MRSLWRPIRSKPWLSALVVLVLIAAGGTAFWWNGRGSKAAAATTYRLVAASTGTIRQSLSSTGTIEPAVQDQLSFSVSGQIIGVRVKAGQKVAAGAVLATVDSASLKASLAQAQASLASAQAKVDADTSASATQTAADNASLTAAQGQVSSAQTALTDANLTSPIAGVVASVSYTVGQQVSGSSSSSSGGGTGSGSASGFSSGSGSGSSSTSTNSSSSSANSSGIEVISDNSWIVNATVDDTQVGLVAVGDQAEISGTSASASTRTGASTTTGAGATAAGGTGSAAGGAGSNLVYGTVSSIGLIASSTSGVASYPVVVKITGSPAGLHAGATGTVSMIYQQLSNVLTVPSTAVHQVDGKSVVYEMAGGKQVAHTVTTGLSSGGTTQISTGLAEGTQVVVELPRATTGGGSTGTNRGGRTGFGGGTGGFGGGAGGFGGGTGGGFAGGGAGGLTGGNGNR